MERKYGESLISLLYPRRCPACHDIVSKRGEWICPECRDDFSFTRSPVCMKCGQELDAEEQELCYDCSRGHRDFEQSTALINYDSTAAASMAKFKYGGRREYADYYISELVKRKGALIAGWRPQLIIPVPVHKSRRRERGYNQAEALAVRLGKALHLPVRSDLLVREKKTIAQKELGPAARQHNLEQALRVKQPLTGLKRVLVVDDIYTTGSTLQACTRALQAAGAEKVYGCVICIGRGPS